MERANFSKTLVPVYQVTIHCSTGRHISLLVWYIKVLCSTVTFIIHKFDVSHSFRAGGYIL